MTAPPTRRPAGPGAPEDSRQAVHFAAEKPGIGLAIRGDRWHVPPPLQSVAQPACRVPP